MDKFENKKLSELLELAREWGLSGYSKLKKTELIRLLTRKVSQLAVKSPRKASPAAPASKKVSPKTNPARPTSSKVAERKAAARKTAAAHHKAAAVGKRLPEAYQDGRMTLLTRDPFWLYCYWDLTDEQQEKLWSGDNPSLRLVEDTGAGAPAREVKRIPLARGARSWYIQVDAADRPYRAELGHSGPGGEFLPLAASNLSNRAPATVASSGGVEFVLPGKAQKTAAAAAAASSVEATREQADRMFVLSAGARRGFAGSGEALSELAERLQRGLASEQLHSGAQAQPPAQEQADYWLVVDAELIVYGATVPGSRVTIRNMPVEVDGSGRFWARLALPDGTLNVPIHGRSPDGRFERQARIEARRATEPPR
ncbi:MAG: DUF4912 domain-containing protein [Myxococcales bacterium]|nr:DUF4912 domain-containing protein [Myxococcales bacterium]